MDPFSLKELNSLIKNTLDIQLEPSYWVIAEISEIRPNQKGHCYLELIQKEDDVLVAKSKATIWSYSYRSISAWFEAVTGKRLQSGMKILANVCVQFHELYGLSLNIKEIDPNFTLGEKARKKQEIINQLIADGIFEMNKEVEMPQILQRIAVISSSSAAGFGDFVNQLENNAAGYIFNIKLFQATMQGEQAKNSIIKALHEVFDKADKFDVLVIIRGGGAQADLDCFDNYDIAAHVAQFPLPVLTGIGHDRDETIVDLVAHTKLKTPTAVAEFLICNMRDLDQKLHELGGRILLTAENYITSINHRLENLTNQLKFISHQKFSEHAVYVDHLKSNISNLANLAMLKQKNKLEHNIQKLRKLPKQFIHHQHEKLLFISRQFNILDPKNVLKRGYSITTINGNLIDKAGEINKNALITTQTSTYKIISIIQDISDNEKNYI